MIKLQTKVRAGFSLQDVAVHVKNADALAQWHREETCDRGLKENL